MAGTPPTLAQLRPALQLALDVASGTAGPLPGRVRSVVRGRRLPPNWQLTVRHALEDDEAFRARVAASADEGRLGRLAWLWLTRPDGWAEEVEDLVGAAAESEERDREAQAAAQRIAGLEEELARARSAAGAELDAARHEHERAVGSLKERLRAARAETRDRAADAAAAGQRVAALEGENAALQERIAGLEAVISGLHSEMAEMAGALDSTAARAERAEADRAAAAGRHRRAEASLAELRRQVGVAVGHAAGAAREVGEALAEAAAALSSGPGPGGGGGPSVGRPPVGGAGGGRAAAPVTGRAPAPGGHPVPAPVPAPPWRPPTAPVTGRGSRSRGPEPPARPGARRRRPVPLPPAVFDDSPEAAEYLVRASAAELVIDGYNVTFTSWSGSDLPDLRHRLITALSELAVRVKRPVTVVFDGADAGGRVAAPPVARPWLRILFSASSVEADRVIVDTVGTLGPDVPVVVVTNDRQVRTDVDRLGANVLSVEQLLGVLGRQAAG